MRTFFLVLALTFIACTVSSQTPAINSFSSASGPQCPTLLQPANNAVNVNYGIPQVFSWQKDPDATSYRLRVIEQSGAYMEVNTTDTFYVYTLAGGINYTWNVRPVNMPDPAATCPGFAFSTCAAVANPITITAAGNTDKCATDSVKLGASATGNLQWFLDQQPIPGAVTDSLWVKKPGNYTVRILNGSCYSNASNIIAITNLPTPVKPILTVQGVTTFCEGGSVLLGSNLNINNQWFKDNALITGANGDNYTASATGNYFVRRTNSSSGCHNYSDTVAVWVNPVPATPVITVTGATTFCNGDSAKLQSPAASGNQWLKNGVAIIGATSQQYTVKESGSYTVKVTASNCTSAASAVVAITVNVIPPAPTVTVTGNTSFCSGDSAKLQSSYTSGNQWLKNGTAITGATSFEYFAKEAGSYTVKTTQSGCTSGESSAMAITVNPLPTKPVIASSGTAMNTGTGYTSYQWYLNNNLIAGATLNQYSTTQNGVYKVVVKDNKGCANTSDDFNYVTTAVNDMIWQGYTLQWFPNPVHDDLIIKVSAQTTLAGTVTVRVVNIMGKQVQQQQLLKTGMNKVPLKKLAAGMYWIVLKNGRSETSIKVLKMN